MLVAGMPILIAAVPMLLAGEPIFLARLPTLIAVAPVLLAAEQTLLAAVPIILAVGKTLLASVPVHQADGRDLYAHHSGQRRCLRRIRPAPARAMPSRAKDEGSGTVPWVGRGPLMETLLMAVELNAV